MIVATQGAPEKKMCHTGSGIGVFVGKGVGMAVSGGRGIGADVAVATAVFTLSALVLQSQPPGLCLQPPQQSWA